VNGREVCENPVQYGRIDEIFHFLVRHSLSNEVTGPHISGLSVMTESLFVSDYGRRDDCVGTMISWGCLFLDQYITLHPSPIFIFPFKTET
jgi:hypothetical protein